MSNSIQAQVDLLLAGSNYPAINSRDVKALKVLLPPVDEQKEIAEALSDADALVESLDALIAKKRDMKQAAMQQLLTGRTRLPGFMGNWQTVRLDKVAEISAGVNKPLSEIGEGTLYITVQDLYSGSSVDCSGLTRIRLSALEIEKYALEVGDIIFGKSSVKRDGIGYPNRFLGADEPVVSSGFAYVCRAYKEACDSSYLFHVLRSEPVRRWVVNNSQASALTNINASIARSIPVRMPTDTHEQRAIAEVLSDMDDEIDALVAQREKAELVKQGMMQELLSGRVRLV